MQASIGNLDQAKNAVLENEFNKQLKIHICDIMYGKENNIINNLKAKVTVKEGSTPKFTKPYRVPYIHCKKKRNWNS